MIYIALSHQIIFKTKKYKQMLTDHSLTGGYVELHQAELKVLVRS